MSHSPNPTQYRPGSVALHWLTAIALLAMVAIGLHMTGLAKGPERSSWFALHKSLGLSLLLLVLFRLYWRARNPPPAMPQAWSAATRSLAHHGHFTLYLLLLIVPVAGFLTSAFTAYPISFWGLPLPRLFAENKEFNELFKLVHRAGLYTLIGLSALHALAGISHFAQGSARMLPWRRAAATTP